MQRESNAFTSELLTRVLAAAHQNQPGVETDWGAVRPLTARRRALDTIESLASRVRASRRHYEPELAGPALAEVMAHAEALGAVHDKLADDVSRNLMLDILVARVLGEHHARLPVTQSGFRAAVERISPEAENVERDREGRALHRYRVGDVRLIGVAFMVHEFFGEQQYALHRGGVRIEADSGDTVIDGGAAWGETALYFADRAGEAGSVIAFEFEPDNLRLIEANLRLNPVLDGRIEIVPRPLWHTADESMRFDQGGGRTSLNGAHGTHEVLTETIDDVAGDRQVDFIKLDVEGAEMAALAGAERTIRRDRPKLALSIYHSTAEMAAIPAWVDGLGLGYRLYLDHRWPGPAETILFAQPA